MKGREGKRDTREEGKERKREIGDRIGRESDRCNQQEEAIG